MLLGYITDKNVPSQASVIASLIFYAVILRKLTL